MLLIHGSHDKDRDPRHLRRPGGTHPVLVLASPYCQYINTRRQPGQGCGKLVLHAYSPTPQLTMTRGYAHGGACTSTSAGVGIRTFSLQESLVMPGRWPRAPSCTTACR